MSASQSRVLVVGLDCATPDLMNVKGREPKGIIEPADYDKVRDELAARLEGMPDESGRVLGAKVYKPEKIYREVRGVAPDLIVLFGDLHWRSVGSFGHGTVWVYDNDTGPDDANHAMHGLYILAVLGGGPGCPPTPSARGSRC